MPTGVYKRTEYHKNILRQNSIKNQFRCGANHRWWKGGVSSFAKHPLDSEEYKTGKNIYQMNRRHKLGISKQYRSEYCKTSEEKRQLHKIQNQKYKYLKKSGGKLSIKTIQLVYEDNIKRYGTLTCYLCLKPIKFRKDTLEHKIPLSRGGTNEYINLAIACQKCNCKKHTKTYEEYRKENLAV